MAKKKLGYTNKFEENALRESALIISKQFRNSYDNMVPYRIDKNTVILLNPNNNREEQAQKYLDKLKNNRNRY